MSSGHIYNVKSKENDTEGVSKFLNGCSIQICRRKTTMELKRHIQYINIGQNQAFTLAYQYCDIDSYIAAHLGHTDTCSCR